MESGLLNPSRGLRGLVLAAALLAGQPVHAEKPWTIPALREWSDVAGSYSFGTGTRIVLDPSSAAGIAASALLFRSDLLALTGLEAPIVTSASAQAGDIFLALGAADPAIGEEGYLLTVADHLTIRAQTDTGVFYGTRSVLQMLRQGFVIGAGTARDWPDFKERALMVDVGRKYFSVAFLQRHIKDLAYLKLNYLHLHLSDNQGFRLESSSHPEITSAQHYSKTEMADLIALANAHHVMIVPEIDVPAHSAAILAPHPDLALPGVWGRLDLSQSASYALVQDLLNEYLALFPAPFWHTGADEYLDPAAYANYPQLLTYARGHYGPSATAEDTYIGFVNWVNSLVKAQGKQLRTWNDVYGVVGGTQVPNTDTVLEMWWPFISPQDALAKGHTIMNANLFTLYYVLGDRTPNPADLYYSWAPNKQWIARVTDLGPFYLDLPASTPGVRGGKLHVWCDSPDAQTEEQVQDGIAADLRAVAQNSWGSPKVVDSFTAFTGIMDPIGHTPDWGPDFALMPQSKSATISLGQTATLPVRLAAINGFNQQVALSCRLTTPQTGMTCSVSPAAITPAAGMDAPAVTLSVRTTGGASASAVPAAGLVLGFFCVALVACRVRPSHRLRAGLLVAVLATAGCGSPSASLPPTPTPTPTPTPVTQPGTYAVLLQASSGQLAHSITLSVTVSAASHSVAARRSL